MSTEPAYAIEVREVDGKLYVGLIARDTSSNRHAVTHFDSQAAKTFIAAFQATLDDLLRREKATSP